MSELDNYYTSRKRILAEVQMLQYQISTCEHCLVLKEMACRLIAIMPPEPLVIQKQSAMMYLINQEPPK